MKLTNKQLFIEKNKYEQKYLDDGHKFICGIDEVGRGPLAGPVTVAAVILDPNKPIYGLKDSKKLSKKKIGELAKEIKTNAISYSIVSATPQTIDKIGIAKSIDSCMRKCVYKLEVKPTIIFTDFLNVKFKNSESVAIVKGDDNSNSIAAASIIAKDFRDRKMETLGKQYPEYKFENHVGYGTKVHLAAIEEFGPIEGIHRYSFKPIRKDK